MQNQKFVSDLKTGIVDLGIEEGFLQIIGKNNELGLSQVFSLSTEAVGLQIGIDDNAEFSLKKEDDYLKISKEEEGVLTQFLLKPSQYHTEVYNELFYT